MKLVKFLLAIGIIVTLGTDARLVFAAGGNPTCTLSSSGVAFGSYDVFAATDNVATGTVTLTCGGTATPASPGVKLDKGAHSAALPNRNMSDGTDTLSYNLYLDAAHTQIWGDGTSGTTTWTTVTMKNFVGSTTVYGKITAAQTSAGVGSYSDSVTMTVDF